METAEAPPHKQANTNNINPNGSEVNPPLTPNQPLPVTPSSSVNPQTPKKVAFMAMAVIVCLLIIAGGLFAYTRYKNINSPPKQTTLNTTPTSTKLLPSQTPTATISSTPEVSLLSYFNNLRLSLSIPNQDKERSYYLDSNTGELLDSNDRSIIGKIINYRNDLNLFTGGTLVNDRLYVGFTYNGSSYVGYISINSAKVSVLPENVFHDQQLSPIYPFLFSPDKTLVASFMYGGGVCSSDTGCDDRASLIIFTPELTNFQSPYWENSKTQPPQLTHDKNPFSELGATPSILSWTSDSKYLYITWLLGGLGPPPHAGLAKIGLDGSFTNTGLSTDLAPESVSPDGKYILAANDLFGLSGPILYQPSTGKAINLPYDELVSALRNKYGPDPGDRPGRADSLSNAYFSADSQLVFYSIWIHFASPVNDKTVQYKVDLTNPTVATEVN